MSMMTANSGTGRWIGLGMVAALHVGMFAAISSGLNIRVIRQIVDEIHLVDVAPDIKTPDKPLDVPIQRDAQVSNDKVTLEVDPLDLPALKTEIQPPRPDIGASGGGTGAGTAVVDEPVVASSVDPRHPLTQPEYPPRSRLLNEQGKVRLKLHVLSNGRIDSVVVVDSSGYQRLDEAAIQQALKHWSMVPAAKGGNAVDSWVEIPVVFRLN
jgi:periplasmic protein TonB